MAIRYKVVRKDTRCSIIVGSHNLYTLKYNKDTIVKALPNSLGIMVFKRKHQAQDFLNFVKTGLSRPSIILRVEVSGRGKYPKYISRWVSNVSDLPWFYTNYYIIKKYSDNYGIDVSIPPKGTLCYDTVRVID